MPRVSVCCSVLNQSGLLKDMIGSVVAQTFQNWELVIVDDGSTEDIKELIRGFNDPRISLEQFWRNMGIPHGINWAMHHAVGEYVSVLAADELIAPDKLEFQVKYLDEHPDIDAIWGLPHNGAPGKRAEWEQHRLLASNRSREQWLATLLNLEHVPIGGASMLCRRKVFEEIGYFDKELTIFSDHEWFCRFFERFEGRILPYRWVQCQPNPGAASKATPANEEEVKRQLTYVRVKHPVSDKSMSEGVTVAIPAKDMAKFIPDAIKSVLAQTYQDFEIIVVNDGSTDNTSEVVKSFTDPRITLVEIEKNNGMEEAFNSALILAKYPYFTGLAADDLIESTYLARVMAVFVDNPLIEFVASQTDFIDVDGKPHDGEHALKNITKASNKSREDWMAQFWKGNVYFGAGTYRTKAIRDIGGWRKESWVLSDYEMYLELVQRGDIHIIEEPLTHTRIHASQRSVGLNSERLAKTYADIRRRFYQPCMKVIIATPFYNSQGFSPYIVSMCSTIEMLTKMGIQHDFWELSGDSYIDRAKNTLANKFLEDPDNTHLFMIDSDIQWDPAGFMRMLMLQEEIVVGSYPTKNKWGTWSSGPLVKTEEDGTPYTVGRVLEDGSGLLIGKDLAGGFARFKRSGLEKYREHYKDLTYTDAGADPSKPERVYTEFFACERFKPSDAIAVRWGEDRTFSRRLEAMGMKWWIYTDVDIHHYGLKGWGGNFHEFLKKQHDIAQNGGVMLAQEPNMTELT